jgi:hypothetical protein
LSLSAPILTNVSHPCACPFVQDPSFTEPIAQFEDIAKDVLPRASELVLRDPDGAVRLAALKLFEDLVVNGRNSI